ncbi:hypothetical protein [Hymenobacter crusticola]|uniref:Uncharacterized protein n=1 Tax=Hymenobacter crusticola TaxID=1770526 RepID=A0A243WD64_9BACT|nr:hypothetical protein [Hymenobacter crusticola]OUJ73616.1 hypothetical protein BXP70_11505 [Hymenobacter crusticola]
MKFLPTLLGLLTCASTSLYAQSQQARLQSLDEAYGFHGARFEKDTSAFRDLALAEKAGNTRYYRRASEVKKLGEGEAADITYGFYKGKLSVVVIKTQGVQNSRAVLAALQQQAGPGVKSSPFAQRYSWNGKLVHMSYEENAMSNDAVILLTCKKMKEHELKQALRNRPTPPTRS